MSDHPEPFQPALEEIDRLRKLLGRSRGKQIRNSEHRDRLKATAMAWFRTWRPAVGTSVPDDLIAKIDHPFQAILDATDRNAAKATYEYAFTEAKTALLAGRKAYLSKLPTAPSTETPPDFSPLASDLTMRGILERRWVECSRCLVANAPLAGTVMMGGLLEALFVARANKLSDKAPLFKSPHVPIDGKTKKPLDLRQWTLGPYIDVGRDMSWISSSAKDVATVLRDYRNYIHPEKERSHGITLSQDDARMLWEVTKTLCRELLSMKGAS